MKIGDLVWSYRYANDDLGIVASDTYIIKDTRGQENEYVDILFQENGLQQELADWCFTDVEDMISYFREMEESKRLREEKEKMGISSGVSFMDEWSTEDYFQSALQKKYKEFKNESR